MSQSLAKVLLHLVFHTKGGEHLIPETLEDELHAYIAGICRGQGSEAYRVGGTPNHVHVACTLPRTLSISSLVQQIKPNSSTWIKDNAADSQNFQWQGGYGAFSLGQSQLDSLIRYIDNQKEHHKKISFRDELIKIMDKYGVEYDERYLWG